MKDFDTGDQLGFEGFDQCGCWRIRDSQGRVLAGSSCSECVKRALAYLEDLLYLDKVVSVSAAEAEPDRRF